MYRGSRDILAKIAELVSQIQISPSPSGSGYSLTEIIPLQSIDCTVNTSGNTYAGEVENQVSEIVKGAHYMVTFDDEVFICDGYTADSNASNLGDNGIVTNISISYLNYPFFISNMSNGNYLQVRGSGTHTLKVEELSFESIDTEPSDDEPI